MTSTDLILHVENEMDDVFIVQRAIAKVGMQNPTVHVENAELAVEYLDKCQADGTRRLPGLVLLDLSMPRMGGIELLQWIRARPVIKRMIVLVLTSSQTEEDIAAAYDFGANGYLVKPVGVPEFQLMLESIKTFWFDKNHGPY